MVADEDYSLRIVCIGCPKNVPLCHNKFLGFGLVVIDPNMRFLSGEMERSYGAEESFSGTPDIYYSGIRVKLGQAGRNSGLNDIGLVNWTSG